MSPTMDSIAESSPPLVKYNQHGWSQFKADVMRVAKERNHDNLWESKEYKRAGKYNYYTDGRPRWGWDGKPPIKKDASYEKHQKFKLSQELLFDVYLHGCRPDSMTVKPYGTSGLLIETSESEMDLCEGNMRLKEIRRRCLREDEFCKKPTNPSDNTWHRRCKEYVGGRITHKMRTELQKMELKAAPPVVHVGVDLQNEIVTTWYEHEKVGDIVKQGDIYVSNWGDLRVNITAIIYGMKYTGTYFKNTGHSTLRRKTCNNVTMHLLPACKDGFYRDWTLPGHRDEGICVASLAEKKPEKKKWFYGEHAYERATMEARARNNMYPGKRYVAERTVGGGWWVGTKEEERKQRW